MMCLLICWFYETVVYGAVFNRWQPVSVRGQPSVFAAGVQQSGGQRRGERGSQIWLHGLPRERRSRAVGPIRLCRSFEAVFRDASASLSVLHSRLLCLRNSLSEWFPSTAWAASGLSATRKRTESWRPPCVQPFPSSTRWPTVSSPPFSARWLPVLPPRRPCRRPAPLPPSCTPPLTWTHRTLLTPAPPTEHASSRGGSPLLRSEIFCFVPQRHSVIYL